MYNHELAVEIEQYIENEMNDSQYYIELAKKAPSNLAREIIIGFSNDEKGHAENFKQAYYYITGRMVLLQPPGSPEIPDFNEALKVRILSETRDYKKYGEHYISAQNKYLRNLFFIIRASEAQHAMRIPILLDESRH
jgi:rubrerythrin